MRNLARLIFLFLLLMVSAGLNAQNVNMHNGTENICSGNFYDSGGAGGTYNASEVYTLTICASTPGSQITLNFTTFNLENNFDFLEIHEGPNVSGLLLVNATGTTLNGQTISSQGSGCLTLYFHSDGSVQNAGWAANVACTFPCQAFDIDIVSANPPYYNGDTVRVCQNTNVSFTAAGTYPNNGLNYAQSDATTVYTWDFGDGSPTQTGAGLTSVNHTFTTGGGYFVTVSGVDISSCTNSNYPVNMVMVSTTPLFTGTDIVEDSVCLGETINFSGTAVTNPWSQPIPNVVSGLTFLPDGSGASYTTSITHTMFGPGQTLTDINQLNSICLNMEHSYLGDLTIMLTCPTGQTVTFIQYPNGGGMTHLGEPCDMSPGTSAGIGYTYCWTTTGTQTIAQAANTTNHTYTDTEGNTYTNQPYIPAGNYLPETPLTNLVGCELNGDWTITVTDNLSIDDGYIFWWGLDFNPSIIPPLWTFGNTYDVSQYSWSGSGMGSQTNGVGTAVPTTSGNVNYTFTAVDDFGCSYDTTVSVYVYPTGSPNCCISPSPVCMADANTCALTYNLTATLSNPINSGQWTGTGPGTVTFGTGSQVNTSVTVSAYGSYTFTFTETYSPTCDASDDVVITFNGAPPFTVTATDANCNLSCDGQLEVVSGAGAALPFTAVWSNAQANLIAQNLCAGNFQVTVTDVNGCTATGAGVVAAPTQLTTLISGTNALCNGGNQGTANVNPSGGTAPYTYVWSQGATTQAATGLTAGTFSCTITDNNACTVTASVVISQPTPVTASVTTTPALCFGSSDGTATVSAGGGTSPYTFLWNDVNTQTSATASNLPAGPFTAVVTDVNGCTASASGTVGQPLAPVILSSSGDDALCFGFANGSVDLTVQGGTTPYSFGWTNGATTEDITGLVAGMYTVTVTDLNGCTATISQLIQEPAALGQTGFAVNTTCWGGLDGQVSVTVTGGTTPYQYLWNNGSAGSGSTGLVAGTYTVTVTDANGCIINGSYTVLEPARVFISTTSNQTICIGQSSTITSSTTGGTAPYTYQWNNGSSQTSVTVSPVVTTIYEVFATDARGCVSNTGVITISVNPPVTATYSLNDTLICMGDDITITITPSGGNGNYTYTSYGLPVPNPYTAFPEESQTYEIVVGDDCGSPVQVLQVPVDVLPLPPISFYSDVVSGCDPLTVHFVESTPNLGQTYLWNFGDGGVNGTSMEKNPIHEFDYAGTFDVDLVVTSVWGCENHLIMEDFITVYPIPEARFIANPNVATIVKPVIAFSNLSTNNFLNIWSFGDNDSSQTVSPYHTYPAVPGVYNVFLTVTSEFGCKDMVGGTVEIVDQYTFYAPTAFSPDNDFINDLFFVSGNGIEAGNFKLMIYDRWGILVFETDDLLKPWDGKIQGGDLAPVGTYTWYVKYKDPTGIGHQFSGPVTIVR